MREDSFFNRYDKLNKAQKEAVGNIEGPVLVMAGPGTGKTELLSVRVANILRQTDTPPESILCLTFTDAACENMRARLRDIVGDDAYKVAIHTYHGFAEWVVDYYSESFLKYRDYGIASDLNKAEILEEIFKNLPIDSKLRTMHDGNYQFLKDVSQTISQLKLSNISPTRLAVIASATHLEYEQLLAPTEKLLTNNLRISKKSLADFIVYVNELNELEQNSDYSLITALKRDLEAAIEEATLTESTKPLSKWKQRFIRKGASGAYELREKGNIERLPEFATIYERYQQELTKRRLRDFDDQILHLLLAGENTPEVKENLQERFLYLLVDEFQDTNNSQMALIKMLTDSEINLGRPNVLAVGDDDQAIYKFQGAFWSNMADFLELYRSPKIVTLTENYRSGKPILEFSQSLISRSGARLVNRFPEISKALDCNRPDVVDQPRLILANNTEESYHWITDEIFKLRNSGVELNDIAVIARKNGQLVDCFSVLESRGIKANFSNRHDIFKVKEFRGFLSILKCIFYLLNDPLSADAYILEVLKLPYWQLDNATLYKLSLDANMSRQSWIEVMLVSQSEKLREIALFLLELSKIADYQPLLYVCDCVLGNIEVEIEPGKYYCSNFKNFYFGNGQLEANPLEAEQLIRDIKTFYQSVRNYYSDSEPLLKNFIDLLSIYERHRISLKSDVLNLSKEQGVNLLTAHKSKGLEFHSVFIVEANKESWLRPLINAKFSLPINLPFQPDKDNEDDYLRLLYVAATRARNKLYLCSTKESTDISYFDCLQKEEVSVTLPQATSLVPVAKHEDKVLLKDILAEILRNYQLSVTHFNNFLDIVNSGPQTFLEQNLLRFPQVKSPSNCYGTAIHATLEKLLKTRSQQDVSSFESIFNHELAKEHLVKSDFDKYSKQGSQSLHKFLPIWLNEVNNKDARAEVSFSSQAILVNEARITGKIDRVELDSENFTARVIDYKTSKALHKWHNVDNSSKIKAWKYRNQLYFYKLLIENSKDFYRYKVNEGALEFVDEQIVLNFEVNEEEYQKFKELVAKVYHKIVNLDLPDVTKYRCKYFSDISEFVDDILKGAI